MKEEIGKIFIDIGKLTFAGMEPILVIFISLSVISVIGIITVVIIRNKKHST